MFDISFDNKLCDQEAEYYLSQLDIKIQYFNIFQVHFCGLFGKRQDKKKL